MAYLVLDFLPQLGERLRAAFGDKERVVAKASDPGGDHSKWVSPQKLAALALFLASDGAAEITGAAIPVYGAGL